MFYVCDEPEGTFLHSETVKLYCIVCHAVLFCARVQMPACMHVCVHVCVHECMHACVCMRVCVCVCVCVCVLFVIICINTDCLTYVRVNADHMICGR